MEETIDAYTRACLDKGSNLAEMTEALHVTNAIRGGASLVHGVHMRKIAESLPCSDVATGGDHTVTITTRPGFPGGNPMEKPIAVEPFAATLERSPLRPVYDRM